MIVLTVAKGPDRGAAFEVRDKTRAIIGRNSPDVPVTDLMVSRYHCRLKFENGDWYLKDLGSRNGTRLNGERIQRTTKLKTGDLIAAGYTELEVKLVPEAAEAVTPAKTDIAPQQAEAMAADSSGEIELAQDDALVDESPPTLPEADDRDESSRGAASAAAIEPGSTPVVETETPVNGSSHPPPDVAKPAMAPEAKPVENPVAARRKRESEQAATEWFSAVESQLVVAEKQGWESELIAEDAKKIREANKDDLEVDARVRDVLYYDEDEHWEEVDGDELPPHEDVEVKELTSAELAAFLDQDDSQQAGPGNDDSGEHAGSAASVSGSSAGKTEKNGKRKRRR